MGSEYFIIRYSHYRTVVLCVVALTAGTFMSTLGVIVSHRVIQDLNLDSISLLYKTIVISLLVLVIIAALTNLA